MIDAIEFAGRIGYKLSKTRAENIEYLTNRFKGTYQGANDWDILSNKVQINNEGFMSWKEFVLMIESLLDDEQITFW